MGQKYNVTATPRQKKLAKLLFTRMSDDKLFPLTDRDLTNMAGYKKKKPTTDIIRSKGVQTELTEYIKTTKKVEERLKAKMLRNLDTGLDDDDETRKLAYTQLQSKRDETAKKAEGTTIIAENVNMLSVLGLNSRATE